MSTSHAPSASPTSSTFIHVPTTPKESVVKPNPHPYAIRTTSTGILTRSNSSGHNVAASRHHYVPLSPATRETRKRHRYTKSLTHEAMCELGAPLPLPVPETFTGNGGSNRSGWTGSIRHNRFVQDSVFLSAATLEDLPSNPKLWTASQLATYLATALRVPTDDSTATSLPTQDAGEIIAFTKEANINGRIFLRLIEDDLDKYGISPLWRDALLAASRNLRQNVIKGRIWGGDSDGLESSSCSLPSHPFSSALYNSSSSSVDLADDVRESYRKTRRNRGRVHGMVQSFERSGSFSSESSLERDESQERYHHGRWLKDNITSEGAVLMSPVSDSSSLPSSSPPLPAMQEPAVEEPTVEALLAESEPSGTWGARAWEELDAAPGVTVKRVEEPAAMASNISADTVSRLQSMAAFSGAGTAKSIRLSKGKQDRRVITAIFTPPVNETAGGPDPGSVVESGTSNQADNVHVMRPTLSPADTIEERVAATQRELDLEAELAETRALVYAFRARLEEVERKVADLEVEVSRNEAAREKLISVVTTTQAAEDHVDMLPDVEPDSSASFDSDLSSSTLVDADEELMEIRSMHFSPPPQVMLALEKKSAEEPSTADAHDDPEPASVAEIPHYVLLVGLGVCAVVLRVILKRAGGRGWRL